ncbi:hypothetical protein BCR35DRAFT_43572 [Leucosporidium creatinivorum]|uniref:Uncharacterized protein n=1 Tax=Leucosporidium creatinivorum TaxID=106004 RepID=A0A1Y2FRM1_9BASI|nr:hypothetical protein BCR35DRAFT_43572 [Leucosporidium creatinivorum]
MHLPTITILLGLLPYSLAAPTRRVDPLLNSLFSSSQGGAAADLSYAQAQKAMQENPNLVAHLTDKGRERLEETSRKSVRLSDGTVFQGSGLKQPTSLRTPQQPINPLALPIKNTTPFFTSLRRANEALKHPSTSPSALHVQPQDYSPSIFSEVIQWIALPNSRRHQGFWEVPVDSIQVNGKRIEGPFAGAVFDLKQSTGPPLRHRRKDVPAHPRRRASTFHLGYFLCHLL